MPLSAVSTRARVLAALCVVVVVVVVAGLLWLAVGRHGGARVVDESAGSGWKTIEFEHVRVSIPGSWERLDTDGCEFSFERWAPPRTPPCSPSGGVAFYRSETFDPARGPGLARVDRRGEPAWGGYVYARELAVYVGDDDRQTAARVLRSAH